LSDHILKRLFAKQRGQLAVGRESHVSFVSRVRFGLQRHRFVPERAEHLHSAPVIPHGRRHCSACLRHARHFLERLPGIGNEIQVEKRERSRKRAIREWKLLRIGNFESNQVSTMMCLCELDEARRGINADDAARRRDCGDGRCNGAGP
jgi:hypothetical protein